MPPGPRVVHLTSVHRHDDPRIFLKECRALAAGGFDVTLVAAGDFQGEVDGVDVRCVPRRRGRLKRMMQTPLDLLWAAIRQRADVCHLHDPELIPIGLLLKLVGKRVIYDAHEDLAKQVLGKAWIDARLRSLVARFAHLLEAIPNRFFDAVVAATPPIARRFRRERTVVVQNFPLLGELAAPLDAPRSRNTLIYVGGITAERGAREMVSAMALVPADLLPRLMLVGEMSDALERELTKLPGWDRTEAVGRKSRAEVAAFMGNAVAGLVLFHPLPNHIESYPTKLFEYLSAGLPVIASDFPVWREVVEEGRCGLTVDPLDREAIAEAAAWLLSNPRDAGEMGRRGAEAVARRYSWTAESNKLLQLYRGFVAG